MADRTDAIHRRLRALLRPPEPGPDADLLARFVTDRDEGAFAVLVRRHGPMVLGVCRRVLGCHADAEDAFQATFLVLARRAGVVRPRSLLSNWLHGVAYRTAMEARRARAVRREKERRAAEMRDVSASPGEPPPDLREVLDRELDALPGVYRAAVVACDLEGLTRREAAARLGWSEGAVAGRLARARDLLARRLARHGLAVGGVLGAVSPGAGVPAGLTESTARVGVLVAAGEAAAVAATAPVAALTEGVMKAMLLTKLKGLTVSLVVGCAVLATATAGWQAEAAPQDRPAEKRAEPPRKGERDRLAELEREHDLLLRRVALLEDRLAALEAGRRAAGQAPTAPAAGTPAPLTRPPGRSPAADPAPGGLRPPSPANTPAGTPTAPGAEPTTPAPAAGRPARQTDAASPAARPGMVTRVYAVGDLAADEKQAAALVRVVRRAVEPGSWDAGGAAAEFFGANQTLAVTHTPDAHKQLAELLRLLRDVGGKDKQ
jgi:RNA polymerase sigma factor (sigma-70 family)